MRYVLAALLLLSLIGTVGASPDVLRTQIDEYLVEIAFIDGLPVSGEETRIAVTVVEPQNRTVPDAPAILYVSGGPISYQLTLERVPTTYVTIPDLEAGDYDLRVQIPELGASEALRLSVADPPIFDANPIIGGLLMSLGSLLLVLILVSSRFDRKNR